MTEFFFFQFSEIYLDIPRYTCLNEGRRSENMSVGFDDATSKQWVLDVV